MTPLCLRVGPGDGVLSALEDGVREHLGLQVSAVSTSGEALERLQGEAGDPLVLIGHGHPTSHEDFPDLRCAGGFFVHAPLARAMHGRVLLVFACWSSSLPTRWQLRPRAFLGFEGWLVVGRGRDRRDLTRELFLPVAEALAGTFSLQDVHRAWQIAATRALADYPPTPSASLLPEMLAYNARSARVAPLGTAPTWLVRRG